MPGKKWTTQDQRDKGIIEDPQVVKKTLRDQDKPHTKEVNTIEEVTFADNAHKWNVITPAQWTFRHSRGSVQKKLEGYERKCIEAYVMGWITYHDTQIMKKPFFDHDIYFEWKDVDDRTTTVQIYLNPNDI